MTLAGKFPKKMFEPEIIEIISYNIHTSTHSMVVDTPLLWFFVVFWGGGKMGKKTCPKPQKLKQWNLKVEELFNVGVEPKIGGFYPQNGW